MEAALPLTASPPLDQSPTGVIADRMSQILRTTRRMQAQLQAHSDGEWVWTANRLIGSLVRESSMRLTALASESGCELSTVSRQVAALVRDGYVRREQDPADGRAYLLAPTELAKIRYQEHVIKRDAQVARMLTNWSQPELNQFAQLLSRFNEDLDRYQWAAPTAALHLEPHQQGDPRDEQESN